ISHNGVAGTSFNYDSGLQIGLDPILMNVIAGTRFNTHARSHVEVNHIAHSDIRIVWVSLADQVITCGIGYQYAVPAIRPGCKAKGSVNADEVAFYLIAGRTGPPQFDAVATIRSHCVIRNCVIGSVNYEDTVAAITKTGRIL